MPLHVSMHGIPACIMELIVSMRPFIISSCAGSIGDILSSMPSLVISQLILHIMGGVMPMPMVMPMPVPIIGFIIMGIIIGMGIAIGMLAIGMPATGMPIDMPGIGIGMPIDGDIIGVDIIEVDIIGIGLIVGIVIAFIMVLASSGAAAERAIRGFPRAPTGVVLSSARAEECLARPSQRTHATRHVVCWRMNATARPHAVFAASG